MESLITDTSTSAHPVIGVFPSNWESSRFGREFEPSSERNGDSPIGPMLSVSEYRGVEVRTNFKDGQLPSEDVSHYRVVRPGQLVANLMWLDHGGLGVSHFPGYVSPAYLAFNISERVDPAFAHHVLRSSVYVDSYKRLGRGVRPNSQMVDSVDLRQLPFPLPPLETQQRIADYLDVETAQIDTTVSTLDELIEEMKSRRIELVRSSTRFDGESNKRTVPGVSGREHEENTKGRLGLLSSTVRRGISPSYSTSGLPVVNQKCIRPNGEFDPEFLRHHKEEKNPVRDELLVQAGDILINSTGTGTLGRSCLMSEVPHRLAFDSHVTLVRPRADKILPEYLGWVVESEEERLIRLSVGSTNQIELSRGTVSNLEFYYPLQEVQKEICTFLNIETAKIDKIISTATELRSELLARRSALITEVVTGQRQV